MGNSTLNDIRKFFGIDNIAQFRKEWNDLSDKDKAELKSGIQDDTYTYGEMTTGQIGYVLSN